MTVLRERVDETRVENNEQTGQQAERTEHSVHQVHQRGNSVVFGIRIPVPRLFDGEETLPPQNRLEYSGRTSP